MVEVVGSMSALITPFKWGKLDGETYEKLIKRQINHGMDAVVPVGTTGEASTLSHHEHKQCIEIAVESCKGTQAKVLAGAGSNCTKEAIDLAQFAEKMGADALLCVTPYYNRPTQKGLIEHYKAIAQAVEIPIMLYNVPARTGVTLDIDTLSQLSKVDNIYAIKEASGSMERTMIIDKVVPEMKILSGEDLLNFPILASGGVGVISVTGNLLPSLISGLTRNVLQGDWQKAKEIDHKLYAINRALFVESNPIPIKAAMFIAGLIPRLEYRLPLIEPSKENYKMLEDIIKTYEVEI